VNRLEELLGGGKVQFIALARPLLCQPDLPQRGLEGRAVGSACASCNAFLLMAKFARTSLSYEHQSHAGEDHESLVSLHLETRLQIGWGLTLPPLAEHEARYAAVMAGKLLRCLSLPLDIIVLRAVPRAFRRAR